MNSQTKVAVWKKTSGRCWYCGVETIPWKSKNWFEACEMFCVDHIVPRKWGGGNELEILAPCCRTCNFHKLAMTVEQFRSAISSFKVLVRDKAHAEYLRRECGWTDVRITRLIFYFETLGTPDLEQLKAGAEELLYFHEKPLYWSDRESELFQRFTARGFV